MDVLFSGLGVAALIGLCILAYRHPEGFHRLSSYLFWLLGAGYIATGIFDVGAGAAQAAAMRAFEDPAVRLQILNAIQAIRPNQPIATLIFGIAFAVLLALRSLPSFGFTALKNDSGKDERRERDDSR